MKLMLISDPSSIHTRNWIDGLQENGIEVDIVFIKNWILRKEQLPKLIEERTTLIEAPSFSSLVWNSFKSHSFSSLFKDIRYGTRMHQTTEFIGFRIKEIAEERGIDIIHAHGLASSILLAYSSGIKPYSASAWGSDIYVMPDRYPYLRPLMAKAISEAEFIHVESEISADRVRFLSSSGYNRLFVSAWGVDTSEYTPNARRTSFVEQIPQAYMLSFRSLEPLYRIDVIIRAFAIISQQVNDVMLVIGSEGSFRKQLEDLTRSLGIENKVFFTGFVGMDDKRSLFSNALLYVQCPESDGVSLAMTEAMSSGLPLVSTNVGETPILIQNGENGMLIDGYDPQRLADTILPILQNSALRKRMGENSRKTAIEKHDRSKFFQSFVEALKAVIEK